MDIDLTERVVVKTGTATFKLAYASKYDWDDPRVVPAISLHHEFLKQILQKILEPEVPDLKDLFVFGGFIRFARFVGTIDDEQFHKLDDRKFTAVVALSKAPPAKKAGRDMKQRRPIKVRFDLTLEQADEADQPAYRLTRPNRKQFKKGR